MRVRLTRKLAKQIDEIDLTDHRVGEVFDLPDNKASLLIAERWAILERRECERPNPAVERSDTDAS